jgi:hypothetical protein
VATTLYLRTALASCGIGQKLNNKLGVAQWWAPRALSTTAGTSRTGAGMATVNGPTSGISTTSMWISEPLAAAATISGTITFNIWAKEDGMSANATIGFVVQKVAAQTLAVSDIVAGSIFGTELTTAYLAKNWTTTPASTGLAKGDRIAVSVYADDATSTTMGSGFVVDMYYDYDVANTADTWVQFNENLTFMTFSGAQYIYPTNVASDLATADVDYKAWTSRGT